MNGDADLGRKRRNCFLTNEPDDDITSLSLSLSFRPSLQRVPSPTQMYSLQSTPQQPQIPVLEVDQDEIQEPAVAPPPVAAVATGGRGRRKNAGSASMDTGLNNTIVPPYPWATNHRATVYSYDRLMSRNIKTIQGTMQCKKCEQIFEIEYDLQERFTAIKGYVTNNKESMRDRAPPAWMSPVLPRCKFCDKDNIAKPVFPEDKDGINWLFLLLGQLIGCCTLDQLKYFCKHTKNHRTGAKDRIVYYTYLGLCKQLDPKGPFDP